ncbi:MAG: hypothetical protein K0R39_2841 [Symbiobacteriaceae bacterium]|jgi:hypothetical protein|nr:hypothetical protein [Symbiobacteriaceae bacterium]
MKKLLWVLSSFGLLCLVGGVAALVFFGIRMLKPEMVDTGLQKEMTVLGVTLGTATEADLVARFGPAQQVKQETLSTVHVYTEQGLMFRVDKKSGKLIWQEINSEAHATARGIRPGSTYDQILNAYGATKYVTMLPTGSRVRYKWGTAFSLEFWLNKAQRVEKIAFYHA